MPTLTSAELAQMQADVAATTFDQTFTIKRPVRTNDGTGHYSKSETQIATGVLGSIAQPSAGQMANYGYKIGSLAAWQVRLPVGTNVQENDLLIVGSQTLKVQVVMEPMSREIAMHLLASEVK